MNSTQKMLIKMLRENTGSQFMDSGGAYGRNWQRNQSRKFMREPQAKLEVWAYVDKKTGEHNVSLSPSISVFHFLSEALEYVTHEDKALQSFAKRAENADSHWLQIAEEFAAEYWPDKRRETVNTYNGESYLDQTLQYTLIGETEDFNSGFCVLSIHQGCDVRGGYGKPHVFRFDMDWTPSLFDVARASIFCECRPTHGWSIEPGYTQSFADESNLDTFPSLVLAENEQPTLGKLCARETKNGLGEAFCPICGTKLQAGF